MFSSSLLPNSSGSASSLRVSSSSWFFMGRSIVLKISSILLLIFCFSCSFILPFLSSGLSVFDLFSDSPFNSFCSLLFVVGTGTSVSSSNKRSSTSSEPDPKSNSTLSSWPSTSSRLSLISLSTSSPKSSRSSRSALRPARGSSSGIFSDSMSGSDPTLIVSSASGFISSSPGSSIMVSSSVLLSSS